MISSSKMRSSLKLLPGLLVTEAAGKVRQVALGVAHGAAGLALHVRRDVPGGRGVAGELVTQRAQGTLGVINSARGAALGVVDSARRVAHRVRLVRDAGCVAHLVGNHTAEALLRLGQILLGLGHSVVSHILDIRCTRRPSPEKKFPNSSKNQKIKNSKIQKNLHAVLNAGWPRLRSGHGGLTAWQWIRRLALLP
jgi:hypothetical protein